MSTESLKFADDDSDEETEMESSKDDKKHESIPLLPQGTELREKKTANDSVEETEMKAKKPSDEGTGLKEKKTAEDSVEETERKEIKPPDDGVEETSMWSANMKHALHGLDDDYDTVVFFYPDRNSSGEKYALESFEENMRTLQKEYKCAIHENLENRLLHYAVVGNKKDLVTSILTKSPQTVNKKYSLQKEKDLFPLHIAALLDVSDIATELIKMKADINLQDHKGLTPVLIAARNGSWKVVKTLLQENACISQIDENKNSVLHFAAESNKADVLEMLLYCKDETRNAEARKLLQSKNLDGGTPLLYAVNNGFLEVIMIMLGCLRIFDEYVSLLTSVGPSGETVLHVAAQNGFLECIELFFKENKKWNTAGRSEKWETFINMRLSKGKKGRTALHYAVLNDRKKTVEFLLQEDADGVPRNADITLQDNHGMTPALASADFGHSKLIENDCINQTDLKGNTVLHLAVKGNSTNVLKILLNCEDEKRYADTKRLLQRTNKSGYTALQLAVKYEFLEGIKIMLSCLNCYNDYISLLTIVNKNEKTVLHLAAEHGFLECTKLLFKKYKEWNAIGGKEEWEKLINSKCSKRRTALHYAVINDRKDIVEFLLQEHVDSVPRDNNYKTPLSYAAENGLVQIVSMLLRHEGFDRETDGEGKVPIHHAAKFGHSEVVKILLKDKSACNRTGDGRNCLDIAIDENQVETVSEIIKSEKWKSLLCSKTDRNQTPMRKLIVLMPDIAREVFHKCTEWTGTADAFEVKFNYLFLDDTLHLGSWEPPDRTISIFRPIRKEIQVGEPYTENDNEIKRNHPLMIMVTKKRTELLDHPLVSALLKKKWTGIGLILYLLNVLLYVLFLTMLTGFALDIKAPYTFIDIPTEENVCFEDNVKMPEFAAIAKYCVIVLAVIELLIEILEIHLMFSWKKIGKYLMEKENVLEWITCFCSILFVVNTSGCTDTGYRPEWQWTCGTISVFLAWINLLLLIQKFDWIGIYVVMLYRISKVFMKFFLVFSLLIVAFAVTFHCLLQNQEQFSTVWISLVKTTAMMIGELDYTSIFLDEELHYNVISHVFFYIFMLFMTIVVVNLMVGVAVDNIREFQKEAGLIKKEMQVRFALELEKLSKSSIFRKVSSAVHCDRNKNEKEPPSSGTESGNDRGTNSSGDNSENDRETNSSGNESENDRDSHSSVTERKNDKETHSSGDERENDRDSHLSVTESKNDNETHSRGNESENDRETHSSGDESESDSETNSSGDESENDRDIYSNGNESMSDSETHSSGDKSETDNYVETLRPSKQNWLQKKIGESWKLTEKDIKAALDSGTDHTANEISELKKEMRNMDSKMDTLKTEIITSKTDMQEEMKSLNSKLVTIIQNLKRLDKANADIQPTDKSNSNV